MERRRFHGFGNYPTDKLVAYVCQREEEEEAPKADPPSEERLKGLREAARLVCSRCRKGEPLEKYLGVFHHRKPPSSDYFGCAAYTIHERIEELEGRE